MKTSDLVGSALDWAVETLEIRRMQEAGDYVKEWWIENKQTDPSTYSTHWLLAGPIIEREGIEISRSYKGNYVGYISVQNLAGITQIGDTHLIAAMRCYVASKLGDEVDVPEELI